MFQKHFVKEIILIDIKKMTHNEGDDTVVYDGEEIGRYHDTDVPNVGDVLHDENSVYIVQEKHHSISAIDRKLLLVEKLKEDEQNDAFDHKMTS